MDRRQAQAGEPVRSVGADLDLDERPFHYGSCAALLGAVSNRAEADIWAAVAFLDPLEALQLPRFPRAVNCSSKETICCH